MHVSITGLRPYLSLKRPIDGDATNCASEYVHDIYVNTHGGGLRGQADAIKLGVARALCYMSAENRASLKAEGFLMRDSRRKEREKYGLKKARKAPQFSKR